MTRRKSRRILIFCGMLLLLDLGVSSTASAFSSYLNSLPNGSLTSCTACHVGAFNSGQFTTFESDWNAAGRVWTPIASTDSDADGFSNGVELGDPSGVWTVGQTPQFTTDITNPGDPLSFPALPSVPMLSTWGLALVAGALGGAGLATLRRRHAHS